MDAWNMIGIQINFKNILRMRNKKSLLKKFSGKIIEYIKILTNIMLVSNLSVKNI
jgi:hypothetical protein